MAAKNSGAMAGTSLNSWGQIPSLRTKPWLARATTMIV